MGTIHEATTLFFITWRQNVSSVSIDLPCAAGYWQGVATADFTTPHQLPSVKMVYALSYTRYYQHELLPSFGYGTGHPW